MPLCFDLDGTLGSFGGGYVLLRQALGELWGQEPTAAELQACAGSTDWEIVDELHRLRFGSPLSVCDYEAYDRACLARFEATFHEKGRKPTIHQGIVTGMHHLVEAGHRVWLVSGNTPQVLAFKARMLGVDDRVPRLGSLPHMDRVALIRMALDGCAGPHLYVGDRPHDRDAAAQAGVPFLGVGEAVSGEHPILSAQTEAEQLVKQVQRSIAPPQLHI